MAQSQEGPWREYLKSNPDLPPKIFSTAQTCLDHYHSIGWRSGRRWPGSADQNHDKWRDYVDRYIDVQNLGVHTKQGAMEHWHEKGWKEGKVWPSTDGGCLPSLPLTTPVPGSNVPTSPRSKTQPPGKYQVAVMVQIGQPNHTKWQTYVKKYVDTIRSYCQKKHLLIHMYVALIGDARTVESEISSAYPDAIIVKCENRGMDIGGFLLSMEEAFKRKHTYDVLFKFHTKSDEDWRTRMGDAIAQSEDRVGQVMDKLTDSAHQNVGCVCTKWWLVPIEIVPHDLTNIIRKMNEIGLSDPLRFIKHASFVGGTVFAVRWNVMDKHLNKPALHDGTWFQELEPGRTLDSGDCTHAWERIFGIMVYADAYKFLTYD